jgi:hypothetical protein
MAGIAVGPSVQEEVATKRRNRPRLLPGPTDRRSISLNINPSVDIQLEIISLLEGKLKNEVFFDCLHEFFTQAAPSRRPVREFRSGGKVRVTFILTEQLETSLKSFVECHGCTAACAVTTALAWYFKEHYSIDLLRDPYRPDQPCASIRDRVMQALRT